MADQHLHRASAERSQSQGILEAAVYLPKATGRNTSTIALTIKLDPEHLDTTRQNLASMSEKSKILEPTNELIQGFRDPPPPSPTTPRLSTYT